MWIDLVCVVLALALRCVHGNTLQYTYNIALHAQVAPAPDQVVGSVITTDGLKAAFELRDEVDFVKVFYPFSYEGLYDHIWDVVIIEGWFPMIHDFIQLIRSHSSNPIVLFFCLDPSFPGMNETITYDVDGFLTNSHSIYNYLVDLQLPTQFLMLAADPIHMQPNVSVSKEYNALYIGAGGLMLEYKPFLLEMVLQALPYGLRLYGKDWENVDNVDIQRAYGGILPRFEIANAYSSTKVVLANTIESQRQAGMINNRIFEAMSCSAIILSDSFPELEALAEGTILFAEKGEDVSRHLQWVLDHPDQAADMGRRARALILKKHTWSHRVIEIMNFVQNLKPERSFGKKDIQPSASEEVIKGGEGDALQEWQSSVPLLLRGGLNQCCRRRHCPTLLVVSSSDIRQHEDYSSIFDSHVLYSLCQQYRIVQDDASNFIKHISLIEGLRANAVNTYHGYGASDLVAPLHVQQYMARFEVILTVIRPHDLLDLAMRKLNTILCVSFVQIPGHANRDISSIRLNTKAKDEGYGRLQKVVSYIVGLHPYTRADVQENMNILSSHFSAKNKDVELNLTDYSHYDLLFFRTMQEMQTFSHPYVQQGYPDPCGMYSLRCEHIFGVNDPLILATATKGHSHEMYSGQTLKDLERQMADTESEKEGKQGGKESSDPWFSKIRKIGAEKMKEGDNLEDDATDGKGVWAPVEYSSISQLPSTLHQNKIQPVAVVCFHQFADLCTISSRKEFVSMAMDEYHLILLGGTFDDWLSYNKGNDTIVNYSMIHRVLHVPTSESTLYAQALLLRVSKTYIMHGSGSSDNESGTSDHDCAIGSILGSGAACMDTYSSVVWPLMTSANGAANIAIARPNAFLVDVVQKDAVKSWTGKYVHNQVQRCLSKLHGLGSSASTFHLHPRKTDQGHPLSLVGCQYDYGQDCLVQLQEIVRNMYPFLPNEVGIDSTGGAGQEGTSLSTIDLEPLSRNKDEDEMYIDLVSIQFHLDLHLSNFLLGRDGDLCFQFYESMGIVHESVLRFMARSHDMDESVFTTESQRVGEEGRLGRKACLMRLDASILQLNVTIKAHRNTQDKYLSPSSIDVASILNQIKSGALATYMRGNLFADRVALKATSLWDILQVAPSSIDTPRVEDSEMTGLDVEIKI
jgi:hypothetical protein